MGTKLKRLLAGSAALACAAVAGCGTATATGGTSTPARVLAGQQLTPQQQARADAAAILASFVPPPGARKLASAPGADGGVLGHPQMQPQTPDLIDDVAWWQVPGQDPQAVLSWEASHVSRRFTLSGYGGVGAAFDSWTLPPVAGVLDNRWLAVTVISDGAGGTDLRAEGEVTYTPARPAGSYIPATAVHAVVVTAVPGGNDRAKPPAPLVVTDPATVRRLVALVNGLSLFPPGTYSCPFDDGRGVRLTFLSKASSGKANGPVIKSAVLAVAFAKSNGCGGVQLTIAGAQTGLGWGSAAAEQALSISGMRWKLFGYLP